MELFAALMLSVFASWSSVLQPCIFQSENIFSCFCIQWCTFNNFKLIIKKHIQIQCYKVYTFNNITFLCETLCLTNLHFSTSFLQHECTNYFLVHARGLRCTNILQGHKRVFKPQILKHQFVSNASDTDHQPNFFLLWKFLHFIA